MLDRINPPDTLEVIMPSEKEKLNESHATEGTDELSQAKERVKDLPPDDEANDVRGGALPPSERPGAYLVPPET